MMIIPTKTGLILHTMFMLIECKLKKIISILTFARFSGKGRHSLHLNTVHYEKSKNVNFLALFRSGILLA